MNAELLSTLSTVAFVVAGVSLALSVFFWFFFRIPTVIGDLSGKNAKKSIAKARANNEKSGNKSFKPSATNQERGKLTETMAGLTPETNHKPKSNVKKKVPKNNGNFNDETDILSSNKSVGALGSETTGLLNESEETTLLAETTKTPAPERVGSKVLNILEEIVYIHTDEVIE